MAWGDPKVRVTVSLDSDLAEAIKQLSAVSGKPVSAFLNEVLRHSLPQLEVLSKALQLMNTDPVRASRLLLNASDDAVAQLDEITTKIKEEVKPKRAKKAG